MLPKPFSWNRAEARAGRLDGKFVVGVRTTGIYCLPSCSARQPKPENVTLLKSEAEALAAGLRACKRCRPDLFYRGEDSQIALFDALAARVRAAPAEQADAAALARACGVSQTKLADLLRTHAHMTPAAWLKREHVRAASRMLLDTEQRVVDVGHAAGFESESAFHRQFLALTRMTPGAYRGLNGASVFMLQLPAGYRAQEILSYHARDPASPCERVDGAKIFKALEVEGAGAVIEVALELQVAWVRVHTETPLSPRGMQAVHAAALRMLGLRLDVGAFETRAGRDARMAALLARRPGMRLPLTPTAFDGLCWAIIGQQINIAFASSLRRELLEIAGTPVRGMLAHPSAARVAEISTNDLAKRRFSRSKAEYLVGAAQAVAAGSLNAEALGDGSAVAAERALTRIRGIGTWTARYMLMRGAGFADCAPVGDVALAAALQKLERSSERPGPKEVEALMLPICAVPQPRDAAPVGELEGRCMTRPQNCWATIETRFATFAAWVDTEGRLVRFNLDAGGAERIDRAARYDDRAIAAVRRQVEEYCAGERTAFDLELAARGTEFQRTVWDLLVQIPYGETRSYGEIARSIGQPQAARGVGAANGANPIGLIVPCHRVIGADGSLTGYGGGLPLKRALLLHEAEHRPAAAKAGALF